MLQNTENYCLHKATLKIWPPKKLEATWKNVRRKYLLYFETRKELCFHLLKNIYTINYIFQHGVISFMKIFLKKVSAKPWTRTVPISKFSRHVTDTSIVQWPYLIRVYYYNFSKIITYISSQWCLSGVFIVNFEQISHIVLMILLLTLN